MQAGRLSGRLKDRAMLDWFKRRTAGAPREQLGENENRPVSTEEKVERLVCRLGTNRKPGDELAAESLDPGP